MSAEFPTSLRMILTTREREILGQYSDGQSCGMIAHRLDVTEMTVKAHLKAALRKIKTNNRRNRSRDDSSIAAKFDANKTLALIEVLQAGWVAEFLHFRLTQPSGKNLFRLPDLIEVDVLVGSSPIGETFSRTEFTHDHWHNSACCTDTSFSHWFLREPLGHEEDFHERGPMPSDLSVALQLIIDDAREHNIEEWDSKLPNCSPVATRYKVIQGNVVSFLSEKRVWSGVASLANALLDQKRLTHQEVRKILLDLNV